MKSWPLWPLQPYQSHQAGHGIRGVFPRLRLRRVPARPATPPSPGSSLGQWAHGIRLAGSTRNRGDEHDFLPNRRGGPESALRLVRSRASRYAAGAQQQSHRGFPHGHGGRLIEKRLPSASSRPLSRVPACPRRILPSSSSRPASVIWLAIQDLKICTHPTSQHSLERADFPGRRLRRLGLGRLRGRRGRGYSDLRGQGGRLCGHARSRQGGQSPPAGFGSGRGRRGPGHRLALWEKVVYANGRVINNQMTNCIMPTAVGGSPPIQGAVPRSPLWRRTQGRQGRWRATFGWSRSGPHECRGKCPGSGSR